MSSLYQKTTTYLTRNCRSRRSGQALVEAVVALGVLMVGFVAILTLLNNSLATATLVSNQDIATYLATEGIEVVKNIIDTNLNLGQPFNSGFQEGSYRVAATQERGSGGPGTNPGDKISGNSNAIDSTYLNFDPNIGYNYSSGAYTSFTRTIQIKPSVNQRLHVVSVVQWTTRNGGLNEVKLEDFFFP